MIGQVEIASRLDSNVNLDLNTRITYWAVTERPPDAGMRELIMRELDRIGLADSNFASGAPKLIMRSANGTPRLCRKLCMSDTNSN